MLQKHKDLNPKTLKGKKLRSEGFYKSVAVNLLLAVILFLGRVLPFPKDVRSEITVFCLSLLVVFLVVMLLSLRKIFFVITEDTLYFFHAEVEMQKDSDTRKKTYYHGHGSILLSEILSMKVTYRYPYSKNRTPQLILEGETFTITATDEGKYIMGCIRKAQAKLAGMNPTAIPTAAPAADTVTAEETYVREGLFGEVWTLFESDSAPDFFEEGITLSECIFREEDGMMDLIVSRNGQTVCFNIDEETVYMSDDDTDEEETMELTAFTDLADLQSRMNHFVVSHTKSTLF